MERECVDCKQVKSVDLFPKDKIERYYRDGIAKSYVHRRNQCSACYRDYHIRFRRTFENRARLMFNCIQERLRRDPGYKGRKCTFSRGEFLQWILNDDGYKRVYARWVESNYQHDDVPTVDRIENDLDYSLENIQVLSMRDNRRKDRLIYTPDERRVKEREWTKKKIDKRKEHYLALGRARYHKRKEEICARRRELYKLNGRKGQK